jgi:hypothetical protein
MGPTPLLVILAVLAAGCATKGQEFPPDLLAGSRTRGQERLEAEILSHVRVGMTDAQSEGVIHTLRPGEDWDDWAASVGHPTAYRRYSLGNDAHLILAFGDVSDPNGNIDKNDKVTAIEIIHFDDLKDQVPAGLFPYVRLIHQSPSVNGEYFDPVPLIRAVNALQPLGQEKALRALREYVKLVATMDAADPEREWRYDLDEQRVFLIARTLFVRKDGDRQMPWMAIGATNPDVDPGDKNWPLFPLVMQDDIPFDLSCGYGLAGTAQSPIEHLDYCEIN